MSLDERSDELDRKIADSPIERSVQALFKADERRRLQVRILAVSIALDILLTIGLTVVSLKTNELAHLAQSNQQAVIASCETSNEARRNNKALWDYVFAIPPEKPPTADEQKQLDSFKQFVAKTFSERDCQAEINK